MMIRAPARPGAIRARIEVRLIAGHAHDLGDTQRERGLSRPVQRGPLGLLFGELGSAEPDPLVLHLQPLTPCGVFLIRRREPPATRACC